MNDSITAPGESVNQYEAERLERIKQNRERMAELGLVEASRALQTANTVPNNTSGGSWREKNRPRGPKKEKKVKGAQPMRESKRLRGYHPESEELQQAIIEEEYRAEGGKTTKAKTQQLNPAAAFSNTTLTAPFSLKSIGTTIWELGEIHRGAWAERYWSSSGCKYHHAYPVGYRATKVVFNKTFEMRIEAGETAPVFKVIDQATGRVFMGTSPTAPFTEACVAHRTGQRISGPLFFGFSDPLTLAAIAKSLYSPEELKAALDGEVVSAQVLSPEEEAAAAFQKIRGIGKAVSIVLANTTTLGGKKHSGPEELSCWMRLDPLHVVLLESYLLNSEELPSQTRNWPAWKARMVPGIMDAMLCGPPSFANNTSNTANKDDEEEPAEQQKQQQEDDASVSKENNN